MKSWEVQYSQVNRATLLGTSNYENAVYLRDGDRRWGIHITDAPKMTAEQARELYSFLGSERAPGVLRHILLNRDLAEFNPAGEPPMTVGKQRVIEASRSPVEAEIAEMFATREAPFDRDVFVLRTLRVALSDRVPALDKIADKRLAQAVQSAPVSARRLPGRKRLLAKRSLNVAGVSRQIDLDGKFNVWVTRNYEAWEAASETAIGKHLETGIPPLTVVQPSQPNDVGPDVVAQFAGEAGAIRATAEPEDMLT